jgi:hypothetical protein
VGSVIVKGLSETAQAKALDNAANPNAYLCPRPRFLNAARVAKRRALSPFHFKKSPGKNDNVTLLTVTEITVMIFTS